MGLDNPLHWIPIVVLLLLLFGARRLPEIGRSLGTGLREFRQSISGEPSQPALPGTEQTPQPAQAPPAPVQTAPAAPTAPAQPAQAAQAPGEAAEAAEAPAVAQGAGQPQRHA